MYLLPVAESHAFIYPVNAADEHAVHWMWAAAVADCARSEEKTGQTFPNPMLLNLNKTGTRFGLQALKDVMHSSNKVSSVFALFSIITFITIVILMIGGFF